MRARQRERGSPLCDLLLLFSRRPSRSVAHGEDEDSSSPSEEPRVSRNEDDEELRPYVPYGEEARKDPEERAR